MKADTTVHGQRAEIAGAEPAIVKRLCVFLRRFVVARKHGVSPDPDLAMLIRPQGLQRFRIDDPDVNALERPAARAQPCFQILVGMVERNHATGFGQTVHACLNSLRKGFLKLEQQIGRRHVVEPFQCGEIRGREIRMIDELVVTVGNEGNATVAFSTSIIFSTSPAST